MNVPAASDDPLEPTIPWEDVQGIILLGFNKDHQALIAWRFGLDAGRARDTLGLLSQRVTTTRTVAEYKHRRRARKRQGLVPDFATTDVWTALALTFDGLMVLTPEADAFTDEQFKKGLPASSPRLGDPSDPAAPGNQANWVVGGTGKVPHGLLVIAGDDLGEVQAASRSASDLLEAGGHSIVYQEVGHNLAHYPGHEHALPSGHEHFGFKDGISQPAPRGRLPNGEFLVPRKSEPPPDPTDVWFAQPGQPLVCAGQFVLGYAIELEQEPGVAGPPKPLGDAEGAIAPAWAKDGSFLVFRRLRQHVDGFQRFIAAATEAVDDPAFPQDRLAAMLVGRWPDGAPVIRSPGADHAGQAESAKINAFGFGPGNPAMGLPDDSSGRLCPIAAHIRKVNPRDLDTDRGPAAATLNRRLLRRGIAYGPPYSAEMAEEDRGLLFMSIQASILDQFEFLSTHWMNNEDLPTDPSADHGMGYDMLVGQGDTARNRAAYIRTKAGDIQISNDGLAVKDWVVPTGGGYFFAPSLTALAYLSKKPPAPTG